MWARQAPDSLGDFLQPEMITTKGHIAYTKQSQNTSPFLTTQKKFNGFSTTAAIVEQAPKKYRDVPRASNPIDTVF